MSVFKPMLPEPRRGRAAVRRGGMGAGTISVWGWGPIAVELGPFDFLGYVPGLDVVIESAAVWFDLGYDAAPQGQILFKDLYFVYKVLIKHKKAPITGLSADS